MFVPTDFGHWCKWDSYSALWLETQCGYTQWLSLSSSRLLSCDRKNMNQARKFVCLVLKNMLQFGKFVCLVLKNMDHLIEDFRGTDFIIITMLEV